MNLNRRKAFNFKEFNWNKIWEADLRLLLLHSHWGNRTRYRPACLWWRLLGLSAARNRQKLNLLLCSPLQEQQPSAKNKNLNKFLHTWLIRMHEGVAVKWTGLTSSLGTGGMTGGLGLRSVRYMALERRSSDGGTFSFRCKSSHCTQKVIKKNFLQPSIFLAKSKHKKIIKAVKLQFSLTNKKWVSDLLHLLTQLICGETQRPHPTATTCCL